MTFETLELQTGPVDQAQYRSSSSPEQPDGLVELKLNEPRGPPQDDGKRRFDSRKWRRLYNKYIAILVVLFINLLFFLGSYYMRHIDDDDFQKFRYPLDIPNFESLIQLIDTELDDGDTVSYESVSQALKRINHDNESIADSLPLKQFGYHGYSIEPRISCIEQWTRSGESLDQQRELINVLIIVRSGVNNYVQRQAIRQSWFQNGTNDLFNFKTIFVVGICDGNSIPKSFPSRWADKWTPEDCNKTIQKESIKYGDLLQFSSNDNNHNLTAKMVASLRWQRNKCNADFFLSFDDNFAFEVNNFQAFLRAQAVKHSRTNGTKFKTSDSDIELIKDLRSLSRQQLYAGYARRHMSPHRSELSEWFVSCKEYHYNRFPAWISDEAVLMSRKSVRHFALATYFVKTFKFHHVYIGIIARKLGVEPLHEAAFMCNNSEYSSVEAINSTKCIGIHEIEPVDLVQIWSHRRQPANISSANLNATNIDQITSDLLDRVD